MNIQKAFGLKVQQLRKEVGMSQEKFALSIDMDRTYLASVEAGRRNNTKNIEYKYTDYSKHYVIGFVYKRKLPIS